MEPGNYQILSSGDPFVGPSYSWRNRARRVVWHAAWLVACRWTPAPMHPWRCFVARCFGARIEHGAHIYPDVDIWAPWNLHVGAHGSLGRKANCYNPALVSIGRRAVVSQGAYLCTASHDYRTEDFRLFAKPISIQDHAWVASEAFVGPGVTIGEGAVLGARGVTFKDLNPWTVWSGNPAMFKGERPRMARTEEPSAATRQEVSPTYPATGESK